jgi:hypothetical protein
VLLRPRREGGCVLGENQRSHALPVTRRAPPTRGTEQDSILVEGDTGIDSAAANDAEFENFNTDEDLAILKLAECRTPRSSGVQLQSPSLLVGASMRVRSGICKFSIQDFTLGAPEPNPYLRQSMGEYLPWLHNCGEDTCPFTESPVDLYRECLESGRPLPNSDLSPGDHIRVDKWAFTRDVHVKVSLELLGYDQGMWRDLEYFTGIVADWYYQEVTGLPMFTVDFGGSIGYREVHVCDSLPDDEKDIGGAVQRSLQFASPSSPSTVTATACEGASQIPALVVNLHPLDPRASLFFDSNLDVDWLGDFSRISWPTQTWHLRN